MKATRPLMSNRGRDFVRKLLRQSSLLAADGSLVCALSDLPSCGRLRPASRGHHTQLQNVHSNPHFLLDTAVDRCVMRSLVFRFTPSVSPSACPPAYLPVCRPPPLRHHAHPPPHPRAGGAFMSVADPRRGSPEFLCTCFESRRVAAFAIIHAKTTRHVSVTRVGEILAR